MQDYIQALTILPLIIWCQTTVVAAAESEEQAAGGAGYSLAKRSEVPGL